jgi:hypothetical protein
MNDRLKDALKEKLEELDEKKFPKATIIYPDLHINAPGTDMHGLQVQVMGGWAKFEVGVLPHKLVNCLVVKGRHKGKIVRPEPRWLTQRKIMITQIVTVPFVEPTPADPSIRQGEPIPFDVRLVNECNIRWLAGYRLASIASAQDGVALIFQPKDNDQGT